MRWCGSGRVGNLAIDSDQRTNPNPIRNVGSIYGSRKTNTRWVIEDTPNPSQESEEELHTPVSCIHSIRPSREDTVLLQWPGLEKSVTDSECIQLIQRQETSKRNRQVHLLMGGRNMNLYCDTGSRFTIIPPDLYKADMREVIPARCHLRAWGAETHLDTKGMLCTTLVTSARAKKLTWVYVVGGTDPEPLLGDTDAEDLGIISTWRETSHSRRASEHCESSSGDIMLTEDPWQQHSCQSMVSRNHSLLGKTHLTTSGRYYLWRMHGHCTGIHRPSLHWTNWTYEDTAITHQYDMDFQPMQPQHILVPYDYQDHLADTSRNWNLNMWPIRTHRLCSQCRHF